MPVMLRVGVAGPSLVSELELELGTAVVVEREVVGEVVAEEEERELGVAEKEDGE